MASGFTQSINQLSPNFYRVSIDMSSTTYFPVTNTLNTCGGVEPFDYNYYATEPSSRNNARRRARGNIRWNNIVTALTGAADCQIVDVTPTNAGSVYTDSNTVSDALVFTVKYERDDFLLQAYNGKTDAGSATIDTVAKAIREIVSQAIAASMTRTYRVKDPAEGEFQDVLTVTAPYSTAANAYAKVSVSLIDTVTVINANTSV
jgi:hypothetical protein